MACHFNEFFSNIANKTVQDINPSSKCPTDLIAQNLNTFKFRDKILTRNEILEATKLLLDKKKLLITLAFQLTLLSKLSLYY